MLRAAETIFTLSIVTMLLSAYVLTGNNEEFSDPLKEEE